MWMASVMSVFLHTLLDKRALPAMLGGLCVQAVSLLGCSLLGNKSQQANPAGKTMVARRDLPGILLLLTG